MSYRIRILLASIAAFATFGATTAFADTAPPLSDASGQALLTPAQARTIAEVRGGGRVTRLDYDADDAVYKARIARHDETRKLRIAAAGGRVVAGERLSAEHTDRR